MAVTSQDDDDLTTAIKLYVGWETKPYCSPDAARVIERFGPVRGEELAKRADVLTHELYKVFQADDTPRPPRSRTDAAAETKFLKDATEKAIATFRRLHPEISDEAAKILDWCYSWWLFRH